MSNMCDLVTDNVTVGKIASDLMVKEPETLSPIEQMRENLTDYEKNIHECITVHKKFFPGDFFVVVIHKRERLMQNVLRNYFTARISCPTPDYDQTVYKYTRENDQIDFWWTIPARDICHLLLENRNDVVPEEFALLGFILKFKDGTLFKMAQEYNQELQKGQE
jgi:hypothetical protein